MNNLSALSIHGSSLTLLSAEPFRAAMAFASHTLGKSYDAKPTDLKPGDGHPAVIFPALGMDGNSVATHNEYPIRLGRLNMNRNNPHTPRASKDESDDNFGPNEDGNDLLEQDRLVPEEVGSDLDESDDVDLDEASPDDDDSDDVKPDEVEPGEFEPDELPVEPDEGPVPIGIPRDPEHDRVIDPGEAWDPRGTGIPPTRHAVKMAKYP